MVLLTVVKGVIRPALALVPSRVSNKKSVGSNAWLQRQKHLYWSRQRSELRTEVFVPTLEAAFEPELKLVPSKVSNKRSVGSRVRIWRKKHLDRRRQQCLDRRQHREASATEETALVSNTFGNKKSVVGSK